MMTNTVSRVLSTRLPVDTYEKLQALAAVQRRSMNGIVVDALHGYLDDDSVRESAERSLAEAVAKLGTPRQRRPGRRPPPG